MLLKIAICDDDKKDAAQIKSLLEYYEINTSIDTDFQIDIFYNGDELLSAYQQGQSYQLLLLDVELANINGIELANQIRRIYDREITVIFISNYPDYMQKSFSVHPYYYITKPLSQEAFSPIMTSFIDDIKHNHHLHTLVEEDGNEAFIDIRNIFYIEATDSRKRILVFHMKDQDISTTGKISDWLLKLSDYGFCLCQRNIIINMHQLLYVHKCEVRLKNDIVLPISRGNRKQLLSQYLNQISIMK